MDWFNNRRLLEPIALRGPRSVRGEVACIASLIETCKLHGVDPQTEPAPGLPEAVWFESRRHGWLFQYGVAPSLAIHPSHRDHASFDNVGVELDAAVVEDAGEPVPMIQAVTDGFCDQGLPGDCMVGVTTVVLERGVGVVIVVTLPLPWMACLRVYALVV